MRVAQDIADIVLRGDEVDHGHVAVRGLQKVKQAGKGILPLLLSDLRDALALVLPQSVQPDAGNDDIFKPGQQRDIFKVAARQHPGLERFAEGGVGQMLGQRFHAALLRLRRQDVDELGRTRSIGIDVTGDPDALLPGLRHQAEHLGRTAAPVGLANGFEVADLDGRAQRARDRDHLLERPHHAAALLPHVDGDGNAGILQRPQGLDQRFGRIEAVRCVAEAEGDAKRTRSELPFDQAPDRAQLRRVQRRCGEAGRAGADGAAAGQHSGMDGAGLPAGSIQIGLHRAAVGVCGQLARDRGQIGLDLPAVRSAAGCNRQAAVAVYDRGQTLFELQLAEMRAEERRVGMAVDVDKAGGDGLPCRVDDGPGLCGRQIADGSDLPVCDADVRPAGGAAGAVDELSVFDQIVEHVSIPLHRRRAQDRSPGPALRFFILRV